jgi:hypothetical protein
MREHTFVSPQLLIELPILRATPNTSLYVIHSYAPAYLFIAHKSCFSKVYYGYISGEYKLYME